MIRVLECFAGIGACSKALTNLNIPHEIVDAVEVDKYAIQAFNFIHGTNFPVQDIREWDKDLEVDLLIGGSPCQDFSIAGKQKGGDKDSGTRSSLMYETLRIVEKLKPKYVIWENVKNLLSEKHRHNFDAYIEAMSDLGYQSKYKVLNAKDYGVPQNRERVFTVSILGENDFNFPEPVPLEKCLGDILEPEVDSKYFLKQSQIGNLTMQNPEVAYCLDANYWKGTNLKQYLEKRRRQVVRVGGLYDKPSHRHQAGSVFDPQGICSTLSTMQGGNQEPIVTGPPQIRKLTPLECWRLMSFDDDAFKRAAYVKKILKMEDLCSAKSKDVIERRKQNDSETCVLNITNVLSKLAVTSTEWMKFAKEELSVKDLSVNVAIEALEGTGRLDCVINITKCIENGETLCTLMDELDQHHTAIIVLEKEGKQSTEKYMKISSEGNLTPMRLFTILILIKLIMQSKTYGSTLLKANIRGHMLGCELCEGNTVKMLTSSLEMEHISSRISSSQLYKMAGNSIVVKVLEAILGELLKGKEE